jgi:hypothetical protein
LRTCFKTVALFVGKSCFFGLELEEGIERRHADSLVLLDGQLDVDLLELLFDQARGRSWIGGQEGRSKERDNESVERHAPRVPGCPHEKPIVKYLMVRLDGSARAAKRVTV